MTELQQKSSQIRAKDAIPIALLAGIVMTLFIFICVILTIPS
jgi:hypothetical protein